MIRPLFALTMLSLTLPVMAQTPPTGSNPPRKIRSVTLVGDQKCPVAESPDEVVVCARMSPDEQYRIPKELRNEGPVEVQRQSWAAKTDRMDEIAREAGGLPDTCSPVGSGGQTGCTKVMLERYRADVRNGNTPPPRR